MHNKQNIHTGHIKILNDRQTLIQHWRYSVKGSGVGAGTGHQLAAIRKPDVGHKWGSGGWSGLFRARAAHAEIREQRGGAVVYFGLWWSETRRWTVEGAELPWTTDVFACLIQPSDLSLSSTKRPGICTGASINFSLVLTTFSSKQEPSHHSTDSLSTAWQLRRG